MKTQRAGVFVIKGVHIDSSIIGHVQGDILLGNPYSGDAKCHVGVLGLCLVGQEGRLVPFYGGVTTLDDGSTSWGDTVEVLRPAKLRALIARNLRSAAMLYPDELRKSKSSKH